MAAAADARNWQAAPQPPDRPTGEPVRARRHPRGAIRPPCPPGPPRSRTADRPVAAQPRLATNGEVRSVDARRVHDLAPRLLSSGILVQRLSQSAAFARFAIEREGHARAQLGLKEARQPRLNTDVDCQSPEARSVRSFSPFFSLSERAAGGLGPVVQGAG